MPAFLTAIFTKIATWLTGKFGAFLGAIAAYVVERMLMKVWGWLTGAIVKLFNSIAKWWRKRQRAKDQEEKQKKVENDIKNGAPIDSDETRKNEEDWLNS